MEKNQRLNIYLKKNKIYSLLKQFQWQNIYLSI